MLEGKKIGKYQIVSTSKAKKAQALVSKNGKILSTGFFPKAYAEKKGYKVEMVTVIPVIARYNGYASVISADLIENSEGYQLVINE